MTGWRTAEPPEASGDPCRPSPNIERAPSESATTAAGRGALVILVASPLK